MYCDAKILSLLAKKKTCNIFQERLKFISFNA